MVMVMPPYHGATIRVPEGAIVEFFQRLSDAISIPIMIQDAPVSGTVLPAALLARMAREIEQVSYFKIETAGAASKLRELIRLGGDAIEGPWDGEEGITLLPDLEAGATGAMTGAGYPDGIRRIVDAFAAGRRDEAFDQYQRWLPLINVENRQCGLLAAKALMKEGGVIACEAPRHPFPPHAAGGARRADRRPRAGSIRWCFAGAAEGLCPHTSTRGDPMFRHQFIRLGLAAAALLLAGASQAQDKGTIGVSMPTKSSARWISDGDSMVKSSEGQGLQGRPAVRRGRHPEPAGADREHDHQEGRRCW